jgi:uncharacterized NAD(P)/FAD-binding protein YdhS
MRTATKVAIVGAGLTAARCLARLMRRVTGRGAVIEIGAG